MIENFEMLNNLQFPFPTDSVGDGFVSEGSFIQNKLDSCKNILLFSTLHCY